MKIIVGLGNPGAKYEKTRHNVGFMAVDFLAQELGLDWEESKKFNALIAKNSKIILVKPQTFMNLSGQTVRKIFDYYKIPVADLQDEANQGMLVVLHDDLDIALGKYKVSFDSRSAGYNGVQSIIDYLGTKKFLRVRIGIKNEELAKVPVEAFVLQKFGAEEKKIINEVIVDAVAEIK